MASGVTGNLFEKQLKCLWTMVYQWRSLGNFDDYLLRRMLHEEKA
jgi:hypothetical protein